MKKFLKYWGNRFAIMGLLVDFLGIYLWFLTKNFITFIVITCISIVLMIISIVLNSRRNKQIEKDIEDLDKNINRMRNQIP